MSWPIGYARDDLGVRARGGGGVVAKGIVVTDADGWIELLTLPAALMRGAPATVRVQLHARSDARGKPYLYLGAVIAEGRRYDHVHMLSAPWVPLWLATIADTVHAAIDRALGDAARAPTKPARTITARRAPQPGQYAVFKPGVETAVDRVSTMPPPEAIERS